MKTLFFTLLLFLSPLCFAHDLFTPTEKDLRAAAEPIPTAATRGNCDPRIDGNDECPLGKDEIEKDQVFYRCLKGCKDQGSACASSCF